MELAQGSWVKFPGLAVLADGIQRPLHSANLGMIWWWIFIVVMLLMAIAMLAIAALLASREGVLEFPALSSLTVRNRFVPILRGACTSIAVYAVPLLIEWTLLRRALDPWLVCVFLADLPGVLLLYLLGHRKAAIVTYTAATLLEATLLSKGLMPSQVMILNNAAPAFAVGMAIAWRSGPHKAARL